MATTPLIEYRSAGRDGYGQRVFPDGRVEEWAAPADDEAGAPAWHALAQLTAAEVARVEAGLADSGFFALPARLAPATRIQDGTTTTWRAHHGERTHTVVAHDDADESAPPLQTLFSLLQEVIGQALNRAADGE